jgi:hypothetical protein
MYRTKQIAHLSHEINNAKASWLIKGYRRQSGDKLRSMEYLKIECGIQVYVSETIFSNSKRDSVWWWCSAFYIRNFPVTVHLRYSTTECNKIENWIFPPKSGRRIVMSLVFTGLAISNAANCIRTALLRTGADAALETICSVLEYRALLKSRKCDRSSLRPTRRQNPEGYSPDILTIQWSWANSSRHKTMR